MSHLIEIRDLKKIYSAGEEPVAALAGVSLTIDSGEFVAIMGASGSGKSTMLNILGCLDTPTSGSYLLDGIEVAGGFVREEDRRLVHQRARDRDALLLSAGKLRGRVRAASAETHALKEFQRATTAR